MHSFLSHIRGRGNSHSAATPPHPENVAIVPPTPALSYGVDSIVETSPAARYGVDRRILENPNSYLDTEDSVSLPHSLSPRTRRHSSGGIRNIQRAIPISENVSEADEYESGLRAHQRLEQSPSQLEFFDRLPPAAAGDWSTFGRQRMRRSAPIVPEFPDRSPTKDTTSFAPSFKRNNNNQDDNVPTSTGTSPSITTFGNVSRSSLAPNIIATQTSNHGRTLSIPEKELTSNASINSSSSPTDTESSRRPPRTPNRPRSDQTTVPSAYLTTPVLRELGFDSPGTFGRPTPENRSIFTTNPSPLPPLPPLNHPALSFRRKDKGATDISTPTASGSLDRSNTFPSGIGDDFLASLSMTFGHSVRHSTSLPKVQHVSPLLSEVQSGQRPRARTISTSDRARHHRRNSASWSAQQATHGVTSPLNTAWPAEVSREILRLSLGEGLDLDCWRPPTGVPEGMEPGSQVSTGGNNVAQFPNQAPILRPFSLSPLSPQRHSSAPQGGDNIPPSLHLPSSRHIPSPLRPASYVHPRMSSRSNDARVVLDGAASPNHSSWRHHPTVGPSKLQGHISSQFLLPPSTTTPTPVRISRSISMDSSTPTPSSRNLRSQGKRKAEDIETTPERKKDTQRATFAVPESHRSQKLSGSSHAPSSYQRKRARLSSSSLFASPVQSRPVSIQDHSTNLQPTPEGGKFSSWSSHTSARMLSTPHAPSRAASTRSLHPLQTPHRSSYTPSCNPNAHNQNHARRHSMSQVSIPISALVSPHAPSIAPSGKFHMRDPRRPPKKAAETSWTLHLPEEDEPGSPVHAWCFFLGFVMFPVWWVAALFLRTPRTRIVGDEKGVSLDDPQIEHDAKAWRFRCRIMSIVSLFTYIPFIILIIIFVRR